MGIPTSADAQVACVADAFSKYRVYAALALPVAAILVLSVAIDLVPRFHMGDSAVFILTGRSGYIPDNRSWSYGLAIGWLLRTTRYLSSVALAQIILSWTAFSVLAIALYRATRLHFPVVVLLTLIGACEPLGYYWSRSMMADSPAQSAFVILCALFLMRIAAPLRILLVAATALALFSLRIMYFPALVGASVATIGWLLARAGRERNTPNNRSLAFGWGLVLGAILLADLAYACVNAYATHGRTFSTDIADMEFLAGALSPLMGDELDQTPLTPNEKKVLVPLTYKNRVSNTFNPHGLVMLVRGHFGGSSDRARPLMRQLVVGSIERHPVDFAELVLRQWLDYLNPFFVLRVQKFGMLSGAVPQFRNDRRVVVPDYIVTVLRTWRVRPTVAADLPSRRSAALSYLEEAGGPWALILAWYGTFSLACVLLVPKNRRTAFLIFINSFAVFYLTTIALAGNQMVPRYLLPLDLPLICTVAAAIVPRGLPPVANDLRHAQL